MFTYDTMIYSMVINILATTKLLNLLFTSFNSCVVFRTFQGGVFLHFFNPRISDPIFRNEKLAQANSEIFWLILKSLILSNFGHKSNKLRNLWRFWSIFGHFWPFLAFKLTLFDNIRVFLDGFWLLWWFSGIFWKLKSRDHVEMITWSFEVERSRGG